MNNIIHIDRSAYRNTSGAFIPIDAPKFKSLLIMKLVVILTLAFTFQASASAYSQQVTLSVKNEPLGEVLSQLRKQAGYTFLFNSKYLEQAESVTVEVHNQDILDVFPLVFRNQPFTYQVSGKIVTLIPKKNFNLTQNTSETRNVDLGQRTIRGRVQDASDQQPIQGVSIQVKGSNQTTATDRNGEFSLIVMDDQAILILTHVSFKTKEYALSGRQEVTISLNRNIQSIDEVQVAIPYGITTEKAFTGAAETISGKTLVDRPRSSFQNSLQGNVSGLQVMTPTGQPGAAPTIRIRGITSFSGVNRPLYVVDGVPMLTQSITSLAESTNTGAGINPNDIESITVLKDASATSIYGSEGANGVIMITTKSGRNDKTTLQLSANYGVSDMTTTRRNKPLTTQEMTALLIEGVIHNDVSAGVRNIENADEAYKYLVDNGLNPDVNTNWMDVITRSGQYEQYNVSASGGNNKTRFYISGGHYKEDAVTKGQGFNRTSGRLNLHHSVNDRLSLDGRVSGSVQNLSTVPSAGAGQNPVRSLYRLVPWLTPLEEDGSYNPAITYNPVMLLRENTYETKIYQVIGNASVKYKILDPLSFETKGGIDFHYSDDFRLWGPNYTDGKGPNGRGFQYQRTWDNWSITNMFKYEEQFKELGLTAVLGQEARALNTKNVIVQADNYAAPGLETLANASVPYFAYSSLAESTRLSFFLNTNFHFQNKYFLNATVRRDGSSRFGEDVRYANFWSIGLSWNAHEEDFIQQYDFINLLKIRGSFGISGNQLGSFYGHLGNYATAQNYMDEPGIGLGQIESASLRWEQNRPLDIGIEFSMFSNRLSGTADWYTRVTSNLFQQMPISYANGLSSINYNVGKMKNYGIELSLHSRNVIPSQEGGFEWETRLNLTTQNNRILAYQDDQAVQSYYLREIGGDFYQFYMRGYAGVESQTGEALWYTDGTRTATTTNYNEAEPFKQDGKSALSTFFGGMSNTFTYKGFSLEAALYVNWGNYIYDVWGRYTHSDGSAGLNQMGQIGRMVYNNRWQQPGDRSEYPKIVFGGLQSGQPGQHSTRFLYDGSYIRLRDVTFSFDLTSTNWKLPVQSAQIFVRGNNLFTFIRDPLLPYDPEVGVAGLLNQNLPISRQYVLGFNITL